MDDPPAPPRAGAEARARSSDSAPGSFSDFCARHATLLAVLLAALLYLPWPEAAPVHGSLEANRLVASRELLRSGDWVVPTLNGEQYLAKPPFQYWLIALASAPFGDVHLWVARLVSGLSIVLLAWIVARWGAREFGPRVGLVAAVLTSITGIVLEKGVLAELEALLVLLCTLSLYGLWCAVRAEGPAWGARLGAALALGAAILTKGPVPFLPWIGATVGLLATERGRRGRVLARAGSIVALGLLVALPWGLLVLARLGDGDLAELADTELWRRLRKAGSSNIEPFWYYGPALLGGLFPTTLFLPGLAGLRAAAPDPARRALVGMLLGWAVGLVLLLSLSSGKEVRYLITGVPAWALLAAAGWTHLRTGWAATYRRGLARAGAWMAPAAGVLVLVASAFVHRPALPAGAVAAALVLAGTWTAKRARARTVPMLLGLALAVVGVKVFWAQVHLARQASRRPMVPVAREVDGYLPAGAALHQVGPYDSEFHFGLDRPIVRHRDVADVGDEVPWLWIRDEDLAAGGAESADWIPAARFDLRGRAWTLARRADEAR